MNTDQIAAKLKHAGLHQRPSQLKMISEALMALNNKQIICLEAPTGTGKTISYGIASHLAKTDQQTVIISTATVALQEQLQNKDIPLLAKILNVPIRSGQAKGRRRYVCHARLFDDNLQMDIFSNDSYRQVLQSLLEKKSWDGDRDTLEAPLSDQEWSQVSTDSIGCSGKLCAYFNQCAFYQARQKWQQCDFVITNHSLLLADLALGGGMLLPKPEKSIYVIDECHHLPSKALDYFARSAVVLPSVDWINLLNTAAGKAVRNEQLPETRQKILQDLSSNLIQALHAFNLFLQQNQHLFEDTNAQYAEKTWRCREPQAAVLNLAQPIYLASKQLWNECQLLLSELEDHLKLAMNDKVLQQNLTKLIAQFGFYQTRLENLYQTWELFCQADAANEPPIARWFIQQDQNFTCHVAPINISKSLKALFWDKLSLGALLCSATIRAVGSFSDYHRKTGLQNHPKLIELALDTCFDYNRSVLFVPQMQHAPQGSEQTQHRQEAIHLLPQLILPRGGTLVLFTSKSAMEFTFAHMSVELQADILMQGTVAKSILLTRHQDKIQNQLRSILFGLTSFGEGLDLPDDLCQHVIIHKLPFAVPTTPIQLTLTSG